MIAAIALVLALADLSVAQDRRYGRGDWSRRGESSGGDVESRIKGRVERAERMIGYFDANQDGVIEPNEIRGQSRYIFERMAKEAGLNPTHSISVAELKTAIARQIDKDERGRGQPAGQSPGQPPPGGTGQPGQPSGPSQPQLGGFGRPPADTPKPGGFGPQSGTAPPSPGGAPPSQGFGQGSPGGSSGSGGGRELDERIRNYADSLLKRYDENKNGVLEKNEWQHMRGSPEKADRNNDGVITLDELTTRLAEFSDRGSPDHSRSSGGSSSGSSSTTSSSTGSSGGYTVRTSSSSPRSGERATYRLLTPLERLPKGLPEWFARKDANADGQVSMAEFSTDWDDAKAGEFGKYDLNHDGIITPEECLQAEKAS